MQLAPPCQLLPRCHRHSACEPDPSALTPTPCPPPPAPRRFQKIEEARPLFWEALVLAIGLAESFRVAAGWATPTGNGFNNLKDEYQPGNLGFDPLGEYASPRTLAAR